MFYCLKRLSELKSFLSLPNLMGTAITQEEWATVDWAVLFLKPFQVATKYVQSDTANLADVQNVFSACYAAVNENENTPFMESVRSILASRWVNNFAGTIAIDVCTALLPRVAPAPPLGPLCDQIVLSLQHNPPYHFAAPSFSAANSFGFKLISTLPSLSFLLPPPLSPLSPNMLLQVGTVVPHAASLYWCAWLRPVAPHPPPRSSGGSSV